MKKLEKFFSDEAEAAVTVTVEKNRQTVEVTVRDAGLVFRAEETAPDMLDAVDSVVDVLVRQIRKHKTRLEKRMRQSAFDDTEPEPQAEYEIVRSKRFELRPMDVEEAILQMEMVGHLFYMFRNAQTGLVSVVYRRKDGRYGLIEPDEE